MKDSSATAQRTTMEPATRCEQHRKDREEVSKKRYGHVIPDTTTTTSGMGCPDCEEEQHGDKGLMSRIAERERGKDLKDRAMSEEKLESLKEVLRSDD